MPPCTALIHIVLKRVEGFGVARAADRHDRAVIHGTAVFAEAAHVVHIDDEAAVRLPNSLGSSSRMSASFSLTFIVNLSHTSCVLRCRCSQKMISS